MSAFLKQLTLSRLLIFITFAAIFIIALQSPLDPDTYWHLRSGEWEIANKAILSEDVFSHTFPGTPWLNAYWIAHLLMFLTYDQLGNIGLAVATSVIATLGMFFIYLTCEGDDLVKAALIILAAAAARAFWSARPHLISFLFSAVVYYLLWLYQKKKIDRLWFIPLLMIFWVNMHPGFSLGFILMILATVSEAVRWLLEGVFGIGVTLEESDQVTLKPMWRLVVIGLVSAAAVLVNPYGFGLYRHLYETISIPALQQGIQEWQSPDFHMLQTWPTIWLLVAAIFVLGLSRRRLRWEDGIYIGGTLYSALLAARNLPTFAIVTAPVLSIHLDDWLQEVGYRLNWKQPARSPVMLAANWLIAVLVVVAGFAQGYSILNDQAIAEIEATSYPVAAVAYMVENDLPGPILNRYEWGGWMQMHAREYPVFIDGRTDLAAKAGVLDIYLAIYYGAPGWEDHLDEYGVNLVLADPGVPISQLLAASDKWEKVYEDQISVVFVRRELIAP